MGSRRAPQRPVRESAACIDCQLATKSPLQPYVRAHGLSQLVSIWSLDTGEEKMWPGPRIKNACACVRMVVGVVYCLHRL